MSANPEPALRLDAVDRSFVQGKTRIDVFKSASIVIASGERVGLVGPSGAGKSSLLHIAGLLEAPDAGMSS